MRIEPEISGAGIVLRGTFNPAIFTPAWFVLHELLPEAAAAHADLELAHPQLAKFSTEWLQLEATPDRFQAVTQEGPYIRVRDLVVRVFSEYLPHTPVNVVGINRDVHFRAPSAAARDRVGERLAPSEPWGTFGESFSRGTAHGGMVSLTMRQNNPDGRPPGGQINVRVEPSVRVGDGRTGIYVGVNDHYQADGTTPESRAELIEFLADDFESSIQGADGIIDRVMALASAS